MSQEESGIEADICSFLSGGIVGLTAVQADELSGASLKAERKGIYLKRGCCHTENVKYLIYTSLHV